MECQRQVTSPPPAKTYVRSMSVCKVKRTNMQIRPAGWCDGRDGMPRTRHSHLSRNLGEAVHWPLHQFFVFEGSVCRRTTRAVSERKDFVEVIDKEGSLTDQIETATKMTSASADAKGKRYTIIVEHLDPELEDWQSLEYKCIGEECANTNADFLLSGLASATATQKQLGLPSSSLTEESVEARYSSADQRKRVCLLDPKGEKDLSP